MVALWSQRGSPSLVSFPVWDLVLILRKVPGERRDSIWPLSLFYHVWGKPSHIPGRLALRGFCGKLLLLYGTGSLGCALLSAQNPFYWFNFAPTWIKQRWGEISSGCWGAEDSSHWREVMGNVCFQMFTLHKSLLCVFCPSAFPSFFLQNKQQIKNYGGGCTDYSWCL